MAAIISTEAVMALGPPGLILVGVLVLWGIAVVHDPRAPSAKSAAHRGTRVAGQALLIVGTILMTTLLTGPFAILAGFCLLVLLANAVIRLHRGEVQFLVWSLSESVQRGIPLKSAAAAFAIEGRGAVSRRALGLADYLDAAMPLSLAMSRAGLWISPEVRFAADVGEKSGTLGPMLRSAVQQSFDTWDRTDATVARIGYVTLLLLALSASIVRLVIWIIPMFTEMFTEFGMQLPATTRLFVAISRWCWDYGYLVLPLCLLLLSPAIIGLLHFMGVPVRHLPLVGRFWSSADSAMVLRFLAVAVGERRPLVGSLELLAAHAPFAVTRKRLRRAVASVGQGMDWCDALARSRLVTAGQRAVLKSAERAGNLAWALDEMADSTVRRTERRARATQSVLVPAAVIAVGGCVAFIATAVLMALFSMINFLT